MSRIPDCRTDDFYNEDFLNEKDKEFVAGLDWCLEAVVNLIKNNLDTYEDELSYVPDEDEKVEDEVYSSREDLKDIIEENADIISECITHWIEMERDELITSMIDNMPEGEFNALRQKVLADNEKSENPKEYFDSRKWAITGRKEFRKENQ